MPRRGGITPQDFEKALDEFFDEMLITPWRRAAAAAEAGLFERAQVIDRRDHYEVRIEIPGADPDKIEVEVVGQRLCVRAPSGPQGRVESSYSFAHRIDQEKVTARWAEDTLVITLPKHKPRQIRIEHG